MKHLFLFATIMFINIMVQAQTDIIYLMDGDSIVDCKIYSVLKGNVVVYSIENSDHQVLAKAISRDGVYLLFAEIGLYDPSNLQNSLYKGHDFDYYQDTYYRATSVKRTGMFFTFLGVTTCALGVLLLQPKTNSNSYYNTNNSSPNVVAVMLFAGGGVVADLGIALWIYGGIKSANNREAMKRCENNVSLSFGATQNGIGFRLALN